MVVFSITLNNPNQDFKGMPLFDVEYLRNDRRYRHAVLESGMHVAYWIVPSIIASTDLQDHYSNFCLEISVA